MEIVETPRLILRPFRMEDFSDLLEYLSDPQVTAFEPYKPMTPEEVRENLIWRVGTGAMIAVELKATGKLIGNVYLGKRDFDSLELGYAFNAAYWGKGYAKESCRAAITRAFRSGTHRIYAECDPNNAPSWHLLEALGFRREGHLRKNVWFWKDDRGNPIWKDTYLYGKLTEEHDGV